MYMDCSEGVKVSCESQHCPSQHTYFLAPNLLSNTAISSINSKKWLGLVNPSWYQLFFVFFSTVWFWNLLRKCNQSMSRHVAQNAQINTFWLNFHFCRCSFFRPSNRTRPILFESAFIDGNALSF